MVCAQINELYPALRVLTTKFCACSVSTGAESMRQWYMSAAGAGLDTREEHEATLQGFHTSETLATWDTPHSHLYTVTSK